MFRLPLFFVFPVLIQMSSLRHSNRSKRPSSRTAAQVPPPQRRRLTVQQHELAVAVPPPPEPAAAVIPSSSAVSQLPLQQANMAVAAPAPSFPSTPGPAVVPFNTPASALQILPSVISQTVASVSSEVTKKPPASPAFSSWSFKHTHGPSSTDVIPPPAPAAVVVAANAITDYDVPAAVASSNPLQGISETYTPAGLSFDVQVPCS